MRTLLFVCPIFFNPMRSYNDNGFALLLMTDMQIIINALNFSRQHLRT